MNGERFIRSASGVFLHCISSLIRTNGLHVHCCYRESWQTNSILSNILQIILILFYLIQNNSCLGITVNKHFKIIIIFSTNNRVLKKWKCLINTSNRKSEFYIYSTYFYSRFLFHPFCNLLYFSIHFNIRTVININLYLIKNQST